MELVADTFLLYKVNEHQCSCLGCAVSLIIYLSINSRNRIGNRKFHSKTTKSLFFKLTQLA